MAGLGQPKRRSATFSNMNGMRRGDGTDVIVFVGFDGTLLSALVLQSREERAQTI